MLLIAWLLKKVLDSRCCFWTSKQLDEIARLNRLSALTFDVRKCLRERDIEIESEIKWKRERERLREREREIVCVNQLSLSLRVCVCV